MMLRKVSLLLSKYLVILLCLITLLLTTPWGTQLTLLTLNNINGVDFDYHSGSLVRDVKLNAFHLQLDTLDITIKGLSTEFDFYCILKNTLCIKSANADYFSLRYLSNETDTHQVSVKEPPIKQRSSQQQFGMPFSVKADLLAITKSHLVINNNEISIDQFVTQLSIKKNELNLFKPTAQQLTLTIEQDESTSSARIEHIIASVTKTVNHLPEINLPITLIIEQLQVDDIVITTNENLNNNCQKDCSQWQSSNNQLSGIWSNTDVSITQFKTTTPTFSINKFTADAKLQPPYKINSRLVSQLNNVPWWPEIETATQKISLQGSLENLTFDIISKGNLALTSQGKINLVHEDMPFNITVDAQKIPTPYALSHYGAYSLVSFIISGDLKQQAIELTSQVQGYGYSNAHVKILATHQQDQFNINQFQFNDSASASQFDLHGNIALLPDNITWQLFAKSTGLSFPQISLNGLAELGKNQEQVDTLTANLPESVTGRVQGKIATTGAWSDNTWSIALNDTDIAGELNNVELMIKADIGLSQSGHLQPGNLLIDMNDSQLALETFDSDFWDIKGKLTIENINHWHQEINGALTSNFSITGEKNNPIIQLSSQFTELNWQHVYSSNVAIEASYQPMRDHQIQLSLTNDQLTWMKENKRFSVENVILTVEGNASQHQVKVNWLGDSTGKLTLTGHWDDAFTHWKSSVEKSKFTYLDATLQNDNIFNIDIDLIKHESIINSHCWQGNGLHICLPNQATIGQAGDIDVNLNIDLSVIDVFFLPKNIELFSQVDGDINVKWSEIKPIEAKAYFALSSGYLKVSDEFSEHQLSQWSQGLFTLTINEQQLTNKILLTDTNNSPLLDIISTIDFIDGSSANDSVNNYFANDYAINAQILLNKFNVEPFQAILTNVVNLQGEITANVSVDGTLNYPSINGNLTLAKGKLQFQQNANTFNNIASLITIKNNQAILEGKFFIEDKEASVKGTMAWQDSLTMNIDLAADTLPLVFPSHLVMSISPSLNFFLIDKSLTISGNVVVLNGNFTIEKLPENSVSLSDDVIIIDQYGKAVVKNDSNFDIKTNITVNIGNAFRVEGQGLKSNLFGQLQIRQKEKHPFQLFGQIQSTKGTFQAYGQKLTIEKGELTFNGPIDNPYFNLRASRNIKAEDIDVGIKITGLADRLTTQLFSSPTMEMPEMLSYLIRGRGLDAGTGNNTAAASLLVGFGVTNSLGLFEQIEKLPLINNIAVDTEGEGDNTQATVSGYVGNRVYLKYGIGVYEPINELTVRMFILNRFWLEIVSGIEQSTDLYYSFDID